jgi:chromosome partitioning protein
MILTVASYKGGVGKTTTAMHLAAYLQRLGPTILFDGDTTRNASRWARRRQESDGPFPFTVAPEEHTAKLVRDFEHIVMDTGQKPTDEVLRALVAGCDLLVVPSVPSFLDSDGLGETIRALQEIPDANYRVLMTRVPPDAATAAGELRRELMAAGVPMFAAEIPRLKAYEKAAGAGLVVGEVDDRNAERAWAAYLDAGSELGL